MLTAVEAALPLKYVRCGHAPTAEGESYTQASEIPGLGMATRDSSAACEQYLVLPREQPLEVRAVRGIDGAVRFLVDQLLNPDSVVDAIIESPMVMIASDGVSSHPRFAGTYSRILARYVRDRKSLTMLDAMKKMSLMPAQRLEAITAAANKIPKRVTLTLDGELGSVMIRFITPSDPAP